MAAQPPRAADLGYRAPKTQLVLAANDILN
jgi:hypothetical protein